MSIRLRNNQRGDTIVEVLIAIAIVSVVLGGAYSISNKSSMQVRNAQEHAEAEKIAMGAVEELPSTVGRFSGTLGVSVPNPVPLFCRDGENAALDVSGSPVTSISALNAPGMTWGTALDSCYSQNRYHTFIERSATDPRTFTVHVRWDGVTGGQQNVELSYRIR